MLGRGSARATPVPRRPSVMKRLLGALPILAVLAAGVETVLVRRALPYRPPSVRLFGEAFLLWLALGLLALVPAWLTWTLVRRRAGAPEPRETGGGAALVLAVWMLLPIALHEVLDRYTGLAGSVERLRAVRPWLEVAGAMALIVAVALGLGRFLGRFRTRALAAGALAAGLALGLLGGFLGARLPAAAAPASADGKPNVLLIVWDTCRRDRLDPYGYDRETSPNLARLAAQSLVFEDARSVSCFTFTSHLSMLTGVYPSTHGARLVAPWYDPRRSTSITEDFAAAGYRTGAFVGTDVLAGRTGIKSGFETYDDQVDPLVCDTRAWKLVHDLQSLAARYVPFLRLNGRPHWIQDFQRPASDVLARAERWIESGDPRPWFAFVNLYDVHWPYLPTGAGRRLVRPYDGPLDGFLFRSDAWRAGYEIRPEDARHVSDLYDGEIFDLDGEVERFLGRLALERGGTALLLTSDHGEAFGEAGQWKHEDIYEPQVRVPMIVRLPEPAPRGSRVAARTSGVDVAPTLLALAGLPAREGVEGVSVIGSALAEERMILVEDRDHVDLAEVRIALYDGRFKLVRRGLGESARFLLHDLDADPIGEVDVSAEHPDVLARLSAELTRLRAAADQEDLLVEELSTGQEDALRALGYAGG